MKKLIVSILSFCCAALMYGQQKSFLPNPDDSQCQQWVNNVMMGMGLKEQIGQLLVYSVEANNSSDNKKLIAKTIKKVMPGGILFSEGTLSSQANLTNYIQSISAMPALICFEGEWGIAAQLPGTPEFPKNSALGCIEDNHLIEAYGREVARELRELGVHVNFAPVADIKRNPENPSINVRSFGAETKLVTDKVLAYSRGLQTGGVLPVLKHFPGQGDTKADADITMPIIPYPRAHLDTVELYPFKKAIDAGIGGIMVGHLKFPALDPERRNGASFSSNIITGLLKDELNFKGLIFSEALYKRNVIGTIRLEIKALKAGNDMILVNGDLERIQREVMQAVRSGEISEKDIEDKCRKVLAYKYMFGLNSRPMNVSVNGLDTRINTPEATQLVSDLRKASVTVLSNYGNVLPLTNHTSDITVVSIGESGKDDAFLAALGKYASITKLHLPIDASESEQKRIASELKNCRRAIISVTTDNLDIEHYIDFLEMIDTKAPVVYAFLSPYRELLPAAVPLRKASAIILAHSAHDELQQQVADIMYSKASATGKMSMPVGELFAVGDGVAITPQTPIGFVGEDFGMKSYVFDRGIDSIVNVGLQVAAFPGCQVLILKDGKPIYDKVFGVHSDKDMTPVRSTDLFDLADLSQTTGTLLAIMRLYDTGKLKLTDKMSQYVPYFRSGNKKDITIQDLLFHESGLAPNVRFHRETIDDNSVNGPFTQGWIDEWHYTRIGEFTWACSDFKFKTGLFSETQTATHQLHVADNMWLTNSFKNTMLQVINQSPMDNKRYIYSPAGFILLQLVVEAITQKPLDEYLEMEFFTPMQLDRTKYLPLRYFTKEEIMPTASNEYFRRQDLCGYVHDELAACQGGISGNAGLFSTAHEVGRIYQMLLNGGELDGKRYLSAETCELFTSLKSTISRRGLGFDKPSIFDPAAPIANPCSPSAPLETYGITGFTGTCTWVDPTNNLIYIFLSNRVCPDVWNDKIIQMNLLQNIQEQLYKSIQ
ncbi:glycoside hydrolase family 3 N-terminal domain-containing protein [Bacteroides sp. 519]|uniref:glycoside hydrolase family 3 N-terminal domain-containing protein n=1 Tax=Bacteroides sp. 519 TaxID=2302937 RepID=UPI0013D20C18|nr:glycoside hydrolase family 3 N-terminal domain-containing protein [Bacteroides sp. 519]NDV59905.1 beta-N-acetylglucosaminidase [Bacteroides sp. 519]